MPCRGHADQRRLYFFAEISNWNITTTDRIESVRKFVKEKQSRELGGAFAALKRPPGKLTLNEIYSQWSRPGAEDCRRFPSAMVSGAAADEGDETGRLEKLLIMSQTYIFMVCRALSDVVSV